MRKPITNFFIKTDAHNRIIGARFGASALKDWTEIKVEREEYYRLGEIFIKKRQIKDSNGIYLYKYEDGKVVKRSDEEIAEDKRIQDLIPTQLDIIEAQVTYTAMLTDTLLEV